MIKIPIETRQIEIIEPDTSDTVAGLAADIALSKQVADVLTLHYPGYSWLVRADHRQGVCRIMCGEIGCVVTSNFMPGMTLHTRNMTDPSITAKKIVRMAGELLERANLRRGRWSGEFPRHVDGVLDRHQPSNATLKSPVKRIV
jgi:hypothetical protein